MIKFGIYKSSQLKKQSEFKGLFGGEKKLSITLYDQIAGDPKEDELAERILLLFSDERGAYKRTYAKRFENFDAEVLNIIEPYCDSEKTLLIQDVAVSDGRTAVDFFEKISNIAPNLDYVASDYLPCVYVLEAGSTKVTLSQSHRILEIVWPPFVFNSIKQDNVWFYPVNRLVCKAIEKLVIPSILKTYKEGQIRAKEIFLFAPAASGLMKRDRRFHLQQHDLQAPFEIRSHIIRAMNVLNHSYFSPAEFSQIMNNIHAGILDGGLLITGSNQEAGSLVHGGIYQKNPAGFSKIWQSGNGSPVENIILQFAR